MFTLFEPLLIMYEEQKIIQNEIQEINNAPQQTEEC